LDNLYHKLVLGILLIEVTEVDKTTHAEEWIMWRLNKLKTLQVLCWVRSLSTLYQQQFYLILEHRILSLLNNSWQSMIYLWVQWGHICWLVPRTVEWNPHMYVNLIKMNINVFLSYNLIRITRNIKISA
jgi:hypothetical protein